MRNLKLALLTGAVLLSFQAQAALVDAFQNGGFEGGSFDTNTHNSQVPPGWTTTSGTPDTFNASTNFAGYTWTASSTGGQFLHGIGQQPSWTESALQVGLAGLVVGKQYEISFEQAISRSTWSETGGFWKVKFGNEEHSSALMAISPFGVFTGWTWQTMMFTATSDVQTLEVIAWSDTDGKRTDIGIDSFFLGDPGSNPNNPVPEPETYALMALGLVAIGLRRRLKKAE